jgi:hypothetical protein
MTLDGSSGASYSCGMTQPTVRASRGAVRYIRKRGGVLYVWLSDSGMVDYATSEPPTEIQFRRLSASNGFALHLDKRAVLGDWVGVERSLLPPWRLLIGFPLQDRGGAVGGNW